MPLQRTQAPTVEPISLAQAKKHINQPDDFTDDDDLIQALIAAARDFAEIQTGRSLCTQQWRLTLDSFPGPSLMGVPFGRGYSIPKHAIVLEHPPILSVDSIQYLDTQSAQQTMPPINYIDPTLGGTLRHDGLARITPVFGQIWPINQPQIGSIWVNYTAGYGDEDDVAAEVPGIIAWMKLRLASLYENREEIVVGTRVVIAPLPFVDMLLDPYTVRTA